MTEEAANALIKLRADDVLELTCLRIGLGVGNGECVGEEALGEAAPTNDIASAALAAVSQFNFGVVHGHQAHDGEVLQRAFRIGIEGMETREFGPLADFGAEPQFLKHVIDTRFVFGGVNGNLSEAAVGELDTAIRETANRWIVGDNQDCVTFAVKIAQKANHGFFVGFVEISGGFVGKNKLGMIDERAGDGDALLFAAGKLRRKMHEAFAQADATEGFGRLMLVRSAVKILREHDVFNGGEIRDEVKLLKDKADFLSAKTREALFVETAHVDTVDDGASVRGRVEAAENIDERSLTGTGRAHDGGPFAGFDAEGDAIERADVVESFSQLRNFDERH